MWSCIVTILLLASVGLCESGELTRAFGDTTECQSYSPSNCTGKTTADCFGTEYCAEPGPERQNHCFNLWEYDSNTGETSVMMKGCFGTNPDCVNKPFHCTQRMKGENRRLFFCCCNGNNCNTNLSYLSYLEQEKDSFLKNKAKDHEEIEYLPEAFVITNPMLLIIIFGTLVISLFFSSVCCYFCYKNIKEEKVVTLKEAHRGSMRPTYIPGNIEFHELKDQGRFGKVWRGTWNSVEVAIKVFQMKDRESWIHEASTLDIKGIKHPNILNVICSEIKGSGPDQQFWMISDFHYRGSLYDYMQTDVFTWTETFKIALTFFRGLQHLHEQKNIDPSCFKPSIAHGDIKPKNILLKADTSVCIADFGSAQVFFKDGPMEKPFGRKGTSRYMSPEMLEGAVVFTRQSFLSMDMYASGLVLWEVLTRSASANEHVPQYMAPYEDLLGSRPTLIQLRDCVVGKNLRPHIPYSWRKSPGYAIMCNIMEECWDKDADARITASCAYNRLDAMTNKTKSASQL
ncbi:activin receptor type-2A-like [Trichogramma pretiosum]|uniref:activin receptor type-2A-like n=1 Tax=Trichogramma pretiosum TaxID=7493 RepID=UPI0006C9ACC5|nr:activin receptor type-2A-like [Trichogramma pretiosum]